MKRLCFKVLSIAGVVAGLAGCGTERELHDICGVFRRLAARADLAELSAGERMAYTQDRVREVLSPFSKVEPLWDMVPASVAESRYRMFKQGAEELLDREWHCAEMKRLAPTLTE